MYCYIFKSTITIKKSQDITNRNAKRKSTGKDSNDHSSNISSIKVIPKTTTTATTTSLSRAAAFGVKKLWIVEESRLDSDSVISQYFSDYSSFNRQKNQVSSDRCGQISIHRDDEQSEWPSSSNKSSYLPNVSFDGMCYIHVYLPTIANDFFNDKL